MESYLRRRRRPAYGLGPMLHKAMTNNVATATVIDTVRLRDRLPRPRPTDRPNLEILVDVISASARCPTDMMECIPCCSS